MSSAKLRPAGAEAKPASAQGDKKKVKKKSVIVSNAKKPQVSDGQRDPNDLMDITEPNVEKLVHALQLRWDKKAFATNLADILVLVNPFKAVEDSLPASASSSSSSSAPTSTALSLFSIHASEQQTFELGPHTFAVARRAYLAAMGRLDSNFEFSRDQTIVILGQSGAGKTVTCKQVLKYLTHVSALCQARAKTQPGEQKASESMDNDSIEAKLQSACPVLEAFGNAKTLRNDNASRFGKWVSIAYTPWGSIANSTITKFGLEESRVVFQIKGERNFHIFYQVLSSLKDPQLDTHSCPFLSASGGTATEDDREDFIALVENLRCMGFQQMERIHLFNVVKAILFLGQIVFVKGVAGTIRVGSATPSEDQMAQRALQKATEYLLGSEKDDSLGKAFCSQILNSGAETITMPRTLEQAEYVRDELAKVLYGRLFNYVLHRVNESLSSASPSGAAAAGTGTAPRTRNSSAVSASPATPIPIVHARNASNVPPHARTPSSIVVRPSNQSKVGVNPAPPFPGAIGLVDLPGFETFVENSLDQLFINFQDEKIQGFFQHSSVAEMELYTREQLEVAKLELSDRAACLELLEERPRGILCILEDEVNTPGGSDTRFLEKVWGGQKQHKHFAKKDDPHEFIVRHYAGPVAYTVDSLWLDTNKSRIGEDVLSIFSHSSIALVRTVVEDSDIKEFKDSIPVGPIKPSGKAALDAKLEGHGVRRRQINAASSLLRASLANLSRSLDTSTPHFIQCVKPNVIKKPDIFDEAIVRQQLACSGVLEALAIRQAGFREHLSHAKFKARFIAVVNGKFAEANLVEQFRTNSKQALESSKNVPRDAYFASVLLKTLCPDNSWQVGGTQVFLRAAASVKLNAAREVVLRRAVAICARKVRSWFWKRVLQRRRQAWTKVKAACITPARDFKVVKAAILEARASGVPEGMLWVALRDAELQQACDDGSTAIYVVIVLKLLRVQTATLVPRRREKEDPEEDQVPSLKVILDVLQAGLAQIFRLGTKYGLKFGNSKDEEKKKLSDELFEGNKDLLVVQQRPLSSAAATLLVALHSCVKLLIQAFSACLQTVKGHATTNDMKDSVLRQCVGTTVEAIRSAVSPGWAKTTTEAMRVASGVDKNAAQLPSKPIDRLTLASFQKWQQDLLGQLQSLNGTHIEGLQELFSMANLLRGVSELEVRLQSAIDQKDLPSLQANLKMAQEVELKQAVVEKARVACEGLKLEAALQTALKNADKEALDAVLATLSAVPYKGEFRIVFEKMLEGVKARVAACESSIQQSQKLSMALKNAIRSKDEPKIKQILENITSSGAVITPGLKAAINEATRGQQQIELREEVKKELAARTNPNESPDVQVARYTNLLSRIQELGMTQMDDAIAKLNKKRNEAVCKQQLQAAIESEDADKLKQVIQTSSQILRNSDVGDVTAINELIRRAQTCLKRVELIQKLRVAFEAENAAQGTNKKEEAFEDFSQAYSMCIVAGVDDSKLQFAATSIAKVKDQWEQQKQARQARSDLEQKQLEEDAAKAKQQLEARQAEKEAIKQKLVDIAAEKERKEKEGPAAPVIPSEITNLAHVSKPKVAGRKAKSNAKFVSNAPAAVVPLAVSPNISSTSPSTSTSLNVPSTSPTTTSPPTTPSSTTSSSSTSSYTTSAASSSTTSTNVSSPAPATAAVASTPVAATSPTTTTPGVVATVVTPPPPPPRQDWTCPVCSNQNQEGLDRCTSCQAAVKHRWLKDVDLADSISMEVAARIFDAFDKDKNGVLDQQEAQLFVVEWCRQHKVAHEASIAKEIWENFHEDGSGNINKADLLANVAAVTRNAFTVTRMQEEAAAAKAEADAEVEAMIAAAAERLERARANLLQSRDQLRDEPVEAPQEAAKDPKSKKTKKEASGTDIEKFVEVMYRVVHEKGVRVRATPSLDGKQTGRLEFGTTVKVLGTEGKWARHDKGWSLIESEGKSLMEIVTDMDMFEQKAVVSVPIPASAEVILAPAQSPKAADLGDFTVIAESGCVIRALPTLNADERGRLRTGDVVHAMSIKKNWMRHAAGWSMLYNKDTVFLEKTGSKRSGERGTNLMGNLSGSGSFMGNPVALSCPKSGVLHILIVSASNLRLPTGDVVPNAYVSVSCGDTRLRTKYLTSTDPEWNHRLSLPIEECATAVAKISVKHRRANGTSVLLGYLKLVVAEVAMRCEQRLGNFDGGRRIRKVWPLSHAESGEIEMSMHFVSQ